MVDFDIIKSDLKDVGSFLAHAPKSAARGIYKALDWSGERGREIVREDWDSTTYGEGDPVGFAFIAEPIAVGCAAGYATGNAFIGFGAACADYAARLYHLRYEAIKEAKKTKPSSE